VLGWDGDTPILSELAVASGKTNEETYQHVIFSLTKPSTGKSHMYCILCNGWRESNDVQNAVKHVKIDHPEHLSWDHREAKQRPSVLGKRAPDGEPVAGGAGGGTGIAARVGVAGAHFASFVAAGAAAVGGTTARKAKLSLDVAIAMFVVLAMLPFAIVENVGFRWLLKYLKADKDAAGNKIQLPGRKKVTDTIRKLYAAKWAFLMSCMPTWLGPWGRVSMMLDGWSSLAKHGYLGITIQFISRSTFDLLSFPIALRRFKGSHTNVRTRSLVEKIWESMVSGPWKFVVGMVQTVCTDNGANIVKAFDGDECITALRCFAHTGQIAVRSVIKSVLWLKACFKAARYISRTIMRSNLKTEKLRAMCETMSLFSSSGNVLSLCLPSPTRWNGEFICLARVLFNWRAIMALGVGGFGFSTKSKADKFKKALNILEPCIADLQKLSPIFNRIILWTNVLGANTYPTGSLVIRAILDLNKSFMLLQRAHKKNSPVCEYMWRGLWVRM
jgi:hypothetical protein